MQGVPLQIVDKKRLLQLIKKLFSAEDTEATCEVEVSNYSVNGDNRRVEVKVISLVRGTFAAAVLKGHNLGNYTVEVLPPQRATTQATTQATPDKKEKEPKK